MQGIFTALITPFKDGEVDYASLEQLIAFQIESGVAGVVPCGTTGESPTMSHAEHKKIIQFVVQKAKGADRKIQVLAGTGSNSTKESIEFSSFAEKAGADGCLLVTPYYNKPTQEGLYRHFKTIANRLSSTFPVVLYNIPGRSAVRIEIDTLKRLSKVKNIIGVKDATGDVDFTSETFSSTKLKIWSGNDPLNYPLFCLGAVGAVSVVSNVFAKELVAMYEAVKQGRFTDAKAMHYQLWEVMKLLFSETNPIPIKTACHLKKMIASDEIRSPLTPFSTDNKKALRQILKQKF